MKMLAPLVLPVISTDNLTNVMKPCLLLCESLIASRPNEQKWDKIFRSEPLAHAAHLVFPDSCHTEASTALIKTFVDFTDVRNRLLQQQGIRNQSPDLDVLGELLRPRSLLVTCWRRSLFDGAVSGATNDFTDQDGMPPWDTWIALVEDTNSAHMSSLLSYIPRWLSDDMEEGILVDAAECMSWLRVDKNNDLILNGWGKALDSTILSKNKDFPSRK
jgi:hypothetical protein